MKEISLKINDIKKSNKSIILNNIRISYYLNDSYITSDRVAWGLGTARATFCGRGGGLIIFMT